MKPSKNKLKGFKINDNLDVRFLGSGWFLTAALFSLINLFTSNKFDAVYVRTIQYVGLFRIFSWFFRAPMIFNVYSLVQCQDWSTFGPPLFPFRKSTYTHFKKRIINTCGMEFVKKSDIVIAQTVEQKTLLSKNYLIYQTQVIYNGHPIPEVLREKESPPLILWIGKEWKNPQIFADMAFDLSDCNALFSMVGATENNLVGHNNMKLKVLGVLSLDEVNVLLEKAALLISTSPMEGFSNSFIQAWLRETPVVSLKIDPDDVIKENGLGRVCQTYDELVAATRDLIRDSQTRVLMGKAARKYAIKNFDIEKNALTYKSVFTELQSRYTNLAADQ
jgi:glycosyltransferase involved in cell wall biosynthesis